MESTLNTACVALDKTDSNELWTPEQQLEELTKRMEILKSGVNSNLSTSFKPNPDDVIVAVSPKSGTTWLLHICHQIRMSGAMPDFDDQLTVIAWIEGTKWLDGIEPQDKPQPAKPRIFSTHLPYPLVPLGGRRLYCFRDQKDALLSAYFFLDSFLSLKGRVTVPIFANVWIQLVEKHLNDLLIWWEHRHDDDLLLLFFDDLKEDHAGCVRRIAKHINVDCNEETISRVVHTTTHSEMVKHHKLFQTRNFASIVAERVGETVLPEDEYVGRVRRGGGKSGQGQQLPLEVKQRIDQLWKEIVTAKLGFQDLNEMREALKNENYY